MTTSSTRRSVARIGEHLAVQHLEGLGCTVLARNWRCADGTLRGELDIVALDERTLVVCEVKARRSAVVDDALEAVTPAKQRQLRRLAGAYVAQLPARPPALRIDVIGVCWPYGGGPLQLTHVRGVC